MNKLVLSLLILFSTTVNVNAIARLKGVPESRYVERAKAFPQIGLLTGEFPEYNTVSSFSYLGEKDNIGVFVTATHCFAGNSETGEPEFARFSETHQRMLISFNESIHDTDYSSFPVLSVLPHPYYPEKNIKKYPYPDDDIGIGFFDIEALKAFLRKRMAEDEVEKFINNPIKIGRRHNPISKAYVNIIGYGLTGEENNIEKNSSGTRRAMDSVCIAEDEYWVHSSGLTNQMQQELQELKEQGKFPDEGTPVIGHSTNSGDSGGAVLDHFTKELVGIISTKDSSKAYFEPTIVNKDWLDYYLSRSKMFGVPYFWDGDANDSDFDNPQNWSGDYMPTALYSNYGYFSPKAIINKNTSVNVSATSTLHSLTLENGANIMLQNNGQLYADYMNIKEGSFTSTNNVASLGAGNMKVKKEGVLDLSCGAKMKEMIAEEGSVIDCKGKNIKMLGKGVLTLRSAIFRAGNISFNPDPNSSNQPSVLRGIIADGAIKGAGRIELNGGTQDFSRAFLALTGGGALTINTGVTFSRNASLLFNFTKEHQPILKIEGETTLDQLVAHVNADNSFEPEENKYYPIIQSTQKLLDTQLRYSSNYLNFKDFIMSYHLTGENEISVRFEKEAQVQSAVLPDANGASGNLDSRGDEDFLLFRG